jgi:aldose 1-epimerase
MRFDIKEWGAVNGRPVHAVTLESPKGLRATVLTYGCILQSLMVPDRTGALADVVLGYDGFDRYLKGHPFFGAVAGRFANRIRDGRFPLNGQTYQLECNEAPTGQHLHGGSKGFDKAVWGFSLEEAPNALWLHLHHCSPDGDSGYPGRLDVVHSIGVDDDNRLWFNFRAVASKDTVLNLVNHSYYNLGGVGARTIEDHQLMLAADFVTPVDETMIPTGAVQPVAGTAWDFRSSRDLAAAMAELPQRDFDNNFVLRADPQAADGLRLAADLYHPASGRGMQVRTTQPAIQFYNGFKLGNREWIGKGDIRYPAFAGLCLETQHFPDSPNQPQFPSTTLPAGRLWEQRTVHAFYRR